jgi:hypothetical protein
MLNSWKIVLVASLTAPAFGQQPVLQITSPSQNASVSVGQILTISVSVAAGTSFSLVGIVATDPLGDLGPLTTAPYQFLLNVPVNIPYGMYQLTAVGVDAAGNLSLSSPVTVSIEPTASVVTLTVQPTKLDFHFAGQRFPLIVWGALADGTTADVTRSAATTYVSANPQVVAVDINGLATAIGPSGVGASIVVHRGSLAVTVPVSVPTAVRGDLNGDGVIDQNDLNLITVALNTPAAKPSDARDLNGDGVINALDARILVTLCTRPGCATH